MANNSIDPYIRHGFGNEPLLSFSRTGDSPVQWIQLLQALDQQDLPGWPFLSPVKIQMQKCDKCSREFCSPINYRRHMRMHRRSLCIDKESHKNRDILGAFWDQLSLDKAKEIVSFDDVTLEEVPGSSIILSLTSFIRKPGFGTYPQLYVKAGSALLDIIQARSSRLPISSQELFAILDDASEGTFLCAGTAESMQRYVFDGEAGKIGLEMKNLVACTSFLVEQKLVKAWVANMDAEALRCQKLLVEEEEAAQKRQAKLLERKRQKKLRQKEQRAREHANGESAELEDATAHISDGLVSSETTNPSVSSESSSNSVDVPMDHPLSLPHSGEASSIQNNAEAQNEFSSEHSGLGPCPNIEHQRAHGSERRKSKASRWELLKGQSARNGFHAGGQDPQVSKPEPAQRHVAPREIPTQVVNGNRVWTRKPKAEHDNGEGLNTRAEKPAPNHSYQTDQNCELMIGSISVTLGNCNSQQQRGHSTPKNCSQEKHMRTGGCVSRSTAKLWRPVSQHGNRGQGDSGESAEVILREGSERMVLSESCQRPCGSEGDANESCNDSHSLVEEFFNPEAFSAQAAKAFLQQRWKEAIAGDHVTVLTLESKPPDSEDTGNNSQVMKTPPLTNGENFPENMVVSEPSTDGAVDGNLKPNLEEGVKIKYIPKQRTGR